MINYLLNNIHLLAGSHVKKAVFRKLKSLWERNRVQFKTENLGFILINAG